MSLYDHANTSQNYFNSATIADFFIGGISFATFTDFDSSPVPTFTSRPIGTLLLVVTLPFPIPGIPGPDAIPGSPPDPAHHHLLPVT